VSKPISVIAPSILAANPLHLGEDIQSAIDAGADWLHVDIMDNHFVPNLSFGPDVVRALKASDVSVPLDVHLMIEPVDRMIEAFAKAGADLISFHPEACTDVFASIALAKQLGVKVGLVLNPETSVDIITPYLHELDLILVMSVHPGFGGQSFLPDSLGKLQSLRKMIDTSDKETRLSIDGGINEDNIQSAALAGADTFVAGSAIFKSPDYKSAITSLREKTQV
jgi:ribulose-phosphate 3-epimerase